VVDAGATARPSGASGDIRGTLSHRQIMQIFSGLMVGLWLAALDGTIVNTALARIGGDLGGLQHISWVVIAYFLTSMAVTPLYGKLADLYGRKLLFQVAVVVFTAGSILCGLAQTMWQLALFRAIQGIGGGGLIAVPFIVVADILMPRDRGRYMGYFTGVFAVAGVTGPMLGGLFVDHLSWRWIFYINVPLAAVAFVVIQTRLTIPFTRRTSHSIDVTGAGLLVAAVVALVLLTSWSGPDRGWTRPSSIGLGLVALVLAGGFLWWESRCPEPILPLRLFRNDVVRITASGGFLQSAAMSSATVYLPTFLQVVTGVSAANSGLRVAPLMAGVLLTSIWTGRRTSFHGRYKHYFIVGAVVLLGAVLFFTRLSPDTSPATIMVAMFVLGMGMGTGNPVLNLATQNAVEYEDVGIATSTVQFTRAIGQSLGVALCSAVLVSGLDERLADVAARNPLPPGFTARTLAQSPSTIANLQEPLHSDVVSALADSIAHIYWFTVPLAVLAVVNALRLREIPLKSAADAAGAPHGME
jgi:EmrB/QacA subfamily drug resistance transporter